MKIVYLSSKVLTDTRQTREQLSDVLYDVTQIVKKKKKKKTNIREKEGLCALGCERRLLWPEAGGENEPVQAVAEVMGVDGS